MGWEERPYYRDRGRAIGNPILWLLTGSIPLGTFFGIRVRAHAALLVMIGLTLLFGGPGYDWHDRVISMTFLFGTVLLHEFGHCFMARRLGGHADEILMWPLGGLAYVDPPHRPGAHFLTALGGPLVNVLICVATAAGLLLLGERVSLNPFMPLPPSQWGWQSLPFVLWWMFVVSYVLLLFNLLPIFPLDGGQMLQAILWKRMGYVRSMRVACVTGMGGAVVLGVWGLIQLQLLLVAVAVVGFTYCRQRRMLLREGGYEDYSEGDDYAPAVHHKRLSGRRAIRRARKLIRQEEQEQARIDQILAKVSAHGMHSLNWWERRCLRKATEHQRQRDLELSRDR